MGKGCPQRLVSNTQPNRSLLARAERGSQVTQSSSKKTPRSRRRVSHLLRWLPGYFWQTMSRKSPSGRVHLVIALADHFEPAYVPGDGYARAPYDEQERRLDEWCREYSRLADVVRDHDGRPFVHTYFYPAEQYDRNHIERLAEHCHKGWGEIEIHLHHGIEGPDTAENTRHTLAEFRDLLASRHGCLSYSDGAVPRYAFVHGNFALANSNLQFGCGVDSEMQILAETGCYADLTLPAAPFHPAQTAKINSLYECALPLTGRAPHRRGHDLQRGRTPEIFPLMVQGPLGLDFRRRTVENAALTSGNPPSLARLRAWKRAGIGVNGRPDWRFIKLHCHSMDPTQRRAVLGPELQRFLSDLVEGAEARGDILHFATAREMVNMILAACDGRDGNPGDYRDYRFKLGTKGRPAQSASVSQTAIRK